MAGHRAGRVKTMLALLSNFRHPLETLRGPEFLLVYGFWFLACWSGLLFLRSCGLDRPLTTVLVLASFEALGVARFLVGSAAGMHRWTFLFLMMGIGALFFLIRVRRSEGPLRATSHSTSSFVDSSIGGGGCGGGGDGGGGGCGGGGCGGCGGS